MNIIINELLFLYFAEDSLKWWDSEKLPNPPKTMGTTSVEFINSNTNKSLMDVVDDTLSINSNTNLISSQIDKKKWYKKIKNPMKKKTTIKEKDNHLLKKAIAE